MTNTIASTTGAALAFVNAANAQNLPDFLGGLAGVALLVWIVIRQSREIDKLRERNRQLADRCKDCSLAQTANTMLTDAGHDRIETTTEK